MGSAVRYEVNVSVSSAGGDGVKRVGMKNRLKCSSASPPELRMTCGRVDRQGARAECAPRTMLGAGGGNVLGAMIADVNGGGGGMRSPPRRRVGQIEWLSGREVLVAEVGVRSPCPAHF